MDDRLTRLEDKLDRLTDAVAATRSDVRILQMTIDAHDAKTAQALIKSNEALAVAKEAHAPLQFLGKVGTIARWLGWVAGGSAALWAVLEWLKRE